MPRFRRILKFTGLGLLGLIVLIELTPMGRYVTRAAWEEANILVRRRHIVRLLNDSTLSEDVRAKLQLVTAARQYAVTALGLDAALSFTTYSQLRRDTLVLVLSAARRDTLLAHTWWFPVVGRFPYKGFFDFAQARRVADDMRKAGYDTYLRPASAFSTLGWFNDPLVSTTLRQDSLSLATTVIHELVHNTLFVKGQVAFNESLASFIGARGAADFFRSRGSARAAALVEQEWADEKLLGTFWATTVHKIDSVFALPGRDSLGRIAARDSVFARMREVLLRDLAPRMPTISRAALERIQLDNAALLARRVYASDLWLFDEVHRRLGGSLRQTIERIRDAVEGAEDPFAALRLSVAGQVVPPNRPRMIARRSIPPFASGAGSGASGTLITTRSITSRTPRSMNRDSWSIE